MSPNTKEEEFSFWTLMANHAFFRKWKRRLCRRWSRGIESHLQRDSQFGPCLQWRPLCLGYAEQPDPKDRWEDQHNLHHRRNSWQKGFFGDGGLASRAKLADPISISLSQDEKTLLIADIHNRRIRAVDLTNGLIRTIAGNGRRGIPKDGENSLDSTPCRSTSQRNGP